MSPRTVAKLLGIIMLVLVAASPALIGNWAVVEVVGLIFLTLWLICFGTYLIVAIIEDDWALWK